MSRLFTLAGGGAPSNAVPRIISWREIAAEQPEVWKQADEHGRNQCQLGQAVTGDFAIYKSISSGLVKGIGRNYFSTRRRFNNLLVQKLIWLHAIKFNVPERSLSPTFIFSELSDT
ncbi:MAG: hypothetical protein ACREFE_07220 [Limisphaerales bacterium]